MNARCRGEPANVELSVVLGLALARRADAHFGVRPGAWQPHPRAADLEAAERYADSVDIFTALQKAGSIEGTDLQTLANNRKELEKIREERSR